MNSVPEHIDELIGRWLAAEISASEQLELDAWAAQSEGNSSYVEQFRKIHAGALPSESSSGFDADAAWEKVRGRIMQREKGTHVIAHPASGGSMWYRAAAAVAVLVVASYFVYQWGSSGGATMALAATNATVTDTLPDGSRVVVNKNSSIEFVHSTRKNVRTVTLKGEAFFEVAHSDRDTFLVVTSGLFIRDIGTAFNVRNETDGSVEVFVREGEVFFFDKENIGIHLSAGETGVYEGASGSFRKVMNDDLNTTAWADKDFRFRNSPLKKVIKKLNEVYDTRIELSNEELGNCRITVNFRKDDIETIAGVIAETLGLEVVSSQRGILLSGPGCK